MAIREDLVTSAVTFLQDQNVATAPLDQRIAFLQSKNLSQEEIDAALARAGDTQPGQVTVQTNYTPQSQQVLQRPPPLPSAQYGGYNQYPGYWQQPPPPEIPKRDWRDYFIMATVMSGVGYGLYFIAKRYIYPIIAPPTPPQLEQDKIAVDEAFERAFNLIEQLSSDTAAIKASEEQRTEKLDAALTDLERTVSDLKEASRKRDDDSRLMANDVKTLQDMLPRAMKTQEKNANERLKELGQELKSLKTLLSNRMGTSALTTTARPASTSSGVNANGPSSTPTANGTPPASAPGTNAASTPEPQQDASNPLARFSAGKGGIPSWQMVASKPSQVNSASRPESETAADADSGA